MSFSIVSSANYDHSAGTSRALESFVSALLDIVAVGGDATDWDPNAALTQTGATWSFLGRQSATVSQGIAIFESTGAAGSGAPTVACDDSFADTVYAAVRPVGYAATPTLVGGAGGNGTSLAVTITASSPAALLGFGYSQGAAADPWATPATWTELLDIAAGAGFGTMQVIYLEADAASVTFDPAGTNDITGQVLQFSAPPATGGVSKLVGGGLVNHSLINNSLVHRSVERIGSLFVPSRKIIRLAPQGA